MKAVILAALAFIVMDANATVLPPVNTNIVNAPKAQFIGSMVTANNDSAGKITATATPLNPQFKDCAACNAWFGNSNGVASGLAAKFTSTNMQTAWTRNGLVGFIGSCVDSQTGNACQVPE